MLFECFSKGHNTSPIQNPMSTLATALPSMIMLTVAHMYMQVEIGKAGPEDGLHSLQGDVLHSARSACGLDLCRAPALK